MFYVCQSLRILHVNNRTSIGNQGIRFLINLEILYLNDNTSITISGLKYLQKLLKLYATRGENCITNIEVEIFLPNLDDVIWS